jgi:predicted nuclease of predicted toxin-antitoxin system
LAPILLDQNIPKRVKDWMKQKGFEIVNLADVNLRGATDKKIAEFAMQNENPRPESPNCIIRFTDVNSQ